MNIISYHVSAEAEAKRFLAENTGQCVKHELVSRDAFLDFVDSLQEEVNEWHFFGPMGVYGYYLGPIENGETIGQQDWDELKVPFGDGGGFVFHNNKAHAWQGPYLAKNYHVTVCGENVLPYDEGPTNYDEVALLYDTAFEDLKVREIEWNWLKGHLEGWIQEHGRKPSLVEVGCGNGQMLRQLLAEGLIGEGHGLDASAGMLERARLRGDEVRFSQIENSIIPKEDSSCDVVLSFMSFRYLDWPRIIPEVRRVLSDGGLFLMVDMAGTELADENDHALYLETKKRTTELHERLPKFAEDLKNLVAHPDWTTMLRNHPKRSAKECEYFLTTQFPEGNWERLYVCYDHSLFAFSSPK